LVLLTPRLSGRTLGAHEGSNLLKKLAIAALSITLLIASCGDDVVGPELATFSGVLVATDGANHSLAGSAEFVDSRDSTGEPTFLIQLFVGSEPDSLSIIMSSRMPRPEPGTFAISGFSDSTFGGIVTGGGHYAHSAGELRISASTRSEVGGTFDFSAQGSGRYGESVAVMGSFSAISWLDGRDTTAGVKGL
jgi:hypothetical protein